MSELVLPGFEPTVRQLDAARACIDPAARVVVLDGAIRSGKTQAGARILLEWAVEQPATYLVARSTYRSLHCQRRDRDTSEQVDAGRREPVAPQIPEQRNRPLDERPTAPGAEGRFVLEVVFRAGRGDRSGGVGDGPRRLGQNGNRCITPYGR